MSADIIEKTIDPEVIAKAYSYEEYSELVEDRYEESRTTNDDNSESMLNYTKLGIQRTKRWDKRGKLMPELAEKLNELSGEMIWLVLTEGWCGDAAQSLPFINKMAAESEQITLRFILRDEHPEIMDQFLTNGGRSVPKLIALDKDSLNVIGEWGPRPAIAQKTYMEERADPDIENKKASENLHLWYARDKGQTIQREFMQLLDEWGKE